ncbi:hypothetical protein AAP_02009 [Ascosphaera apis ARSEF 7405]|uniref:Uncharacterized protein n=1 Tax=Ascosphaera apis ARSEF 7405 TaxID=392613 RepID=A0A168AH04_9EURO|nr:hypothetical protein AAP_02009 [Ascosphaera apis ARSEF 7405]
MSEEEQQYTIQPVKDKQPEKPSEGGDKSKPSAQDFVNPGPAVPGNVDLPPKASREELEARVAELNKKK